MENENTGNMSEQLQNKINQFRQMQMQMQSVSYQLQQTKIQKDLNEKAVKELEKKDTGDVYKSVGNIILFSDIKEVVDELKEKNEVLSARLESISKQNERISLKLATMKKEIESKMAGKDSE